MRTLVLTLGLLGVALISGCSSTHTAQTSTKRVVDKDYVAAVEAAANRSTAKNSIIWVNPPTQEVALNAPKKTEN